MSSSKRLYRGIFYEELGDKVEKLLKKRDKHSERLSKIEKETADLLKKALDEEDKSKFNQYLEKVIKSHSETISELLEKNVSLREHFDHEECTECKNEKVLKIKNISMGCKCEDKSS